MSAVPARVLHAASNGAWKLTKRSLPVNPTKIAACFCWRPDDAARVSGLLSGTVLLSRVWPETQWGQCGVVMSRIHSDRLNAKKAHQSFAFGVKRAVQKLGYEVPPPSLVPADVLGAEPLPFPIPAFLDSALGYGGSLRFVQFGYSFRTRQFEYSDGGDDIPSTGEGVWKWFLRHPLISPHLPEDRCPTLHGIFPADFKVPSLDELMTKGDSGSPPAHHYLLLDRHKLKAYVALREQNLFLFALAQPEDRDPHTLYVDDLLTSPGTEDYKTPPDEDVVQEVRRFFDVQLRRKLTNPSR
jgi:hypothetical protein